MARGNSVGEIDLVELPVEPREPVGDEGGLGILLGGAQVGRPRGLQIPIRLGELRDEGELEPLLLEAAGVAASAPASAGEEAFLPPADSADPVLVALPAGSDGAGRGLAALPADPRIR